MRWYYQVTLLKGRSISFKRCILVMYPSLFFNKLSLADLEKKELTYLIHKFQTKRNFKFDLIQFDQKQASRTNVKIIEFDFSSELKLFTHQTVVRFLKKLFLPKLSNVNHEIFCQKSRQGNNTRLVQGSSDSADSNINPPRLPKFLNVV